MKGEDERNCDASQNYDEDGDNNDGHASPPPGYPIRISPPSDTPSSHQYVVATLPPYDWAVGSAADREACRRGRPTKEATLTRLCSLLEFSKAYLVSDGAGGKKRRLISETIKS